MIHAITKSYSERRFRVFVGVNVNGIGHKIGYASDCWNTMDDGFLPMCGTDCVERTCNSCRLVTGKQVVAAKRIFAKKYGKHEEER